jgi:hypothetical protein
MAEVIESFGTVVRGKRETERVVRPLRDLQILALHSCTKK